MNESVFKLLIMIQTKTVYITKYYQMNYYIIYKLWVFNILSGENNEY